jgi:MFS transporter, UMF1 family
MDQTPAAAARARAATAWALYDFANSAFVTTVVAAVLPVYYASVAGAKLGGNRATVYWAYTVSASALLAALLGPVLGAVADLRGKKKLFLSIFAAVGAIATALLYFVGYGDVLLASALFLVANVGFTGSLVFYDALLPYVALPDEMDRLSSRGYALGYVGGGILLALNLVMIVLAKPEQTGLMARLSFVSVAVWWVLFSIPLLRSVPEPEARVLPGEENTSALRAGFSRVITTFRDARKRPDLFLFLIAFLVYNNGIGTIIHMATIYGAEIGLGRTTLLGTLLLVQVVAAPFAILFGRISERIGRKRSIFIALATYCLIAILAQFLRTEAHFMMLGFAVATVQGGSQALSRSLYGRLVPKGKSAEYFGFYGVGEKISGILGPFVFGLVGQMTGTSRYAIVSLLVFFVAGGLLLWRVDEERGAMAASR